MLTGMADCPISSGKNSGNYDRKLMICDICMMLNMPNFRDPLATTLNTISRTPIHLQSADIRGFLAIFADSM